MQKKLTDFKIVVKNAGTSEEFAFACRYKTLNKPPDIEIEKEAFNVLESNVLEELILLKGKFNAIESLINKMLQIKGMKY